MPTYEYTCTACQHDFERFESITAKPNKTCPKCNKKKAERRISGGGGFLFKGTGFYVTDYKKSGGGGAKPADAGHTCSSGCAHGAAKTETKSETKSESKSKKSA